MARYDNFACWSADLPAPSERELLEWLARFSPRHEAELQRLQWAEAEAAAKARHERELLEFLASFSEKHERELRSLQRKEAEEGQLQEQSRPLAEAEWNEADHPRRGYGPHAGAWVTKGGAGGGASISSINTQINRSEYRHATEPSNAGSSAVTGGSDGAAGIAMSAIHASGAGLAANAELISFGRKKKAAAADGNADAAGSPAMPDRVTGDALAKARREFERMRPQLWREEAQRNPEKYTPEQLARMRKGKAPKSIDGSPMEIHHKKPLSQGGTNTYNNFQFGTRFDHRLGPNLKKNHPNLPRGPVQ